MPNVTDAGHAQTLLSICVGCIAARSTRHGPLSGYRHKIHSGQPKEPADDSQ